MNGVEVTLSPAAEPYWPYKSWEEKVDAIKARCEAAAPGVYIEIGGAITAHAATNDKPWPETEFDSVTVCYAARSTYNGMAETLWEHEETLAFFLAAREDVAFLLAEVERLRVEVARGKGGQGT